MLRSIPNSSLRSSLTRFSQSMQSNFFHAQMDRITDIVETNQFLLDTSFEAALPPKNTTLAYVI